MRQVLEFLDNTLIDRAFQPGVDWLAQYLAVDCYRQARICSNIAAVVWILSQADDIIAALRSGSMGLLAFQLALLLLGLSAFMVLNMLFQRAGSAGVRQNRVNPLRPAMHFHRIGLLLGVAVNVGKAAFGYGSVSLLIVGAFAALAVYVAACSNPPPKPRRRQISLWMLPAS